MPPVVLSTTGEPVPISGLGVASGYQVPTPSIYFETDATHGLFIRWIRLGEMIQHFAPTPIFNCNLWKISDNTRITLDDKTDYTITMTENDATKVITLAVTLVSYSSISFSFTLTPTATGYTVAQTLTSANASYAVESWVFPRLACLPPTTAAESALAHGWLSGWCINNPASETISTEIGSPPSMEFWSFFDKTTKQHFYVSTNDGTGWLKEWGLAGNGTSAVQSWRHHPKNPRKASQGSLSPQTLSYTMELTLFRGLCEDGRLGAVDAAIRYREWATNASRSWMSRGAWATASSVSSRVKNSDVLYVLQPSSYPVSATFFTTFIEDIRRIKAFLGASEMLALLYGWGQYQGALIAPPDFRPPEFTPIPAAHSANLDTALGTANTNNIHCSFYTWVNGWDTTLISTIYFNYLSFDASSAYGAIADRCIKDHTGAASEASDLVYFDLEAYQNDVTDIVTDMILYNGTGSNPEVLGYYRNVTNKPRGWYLDLWGGGGVLLNYDPALSPNGNTGAWETRKSQIGSDVRDAVRAVDANAYFITENTEQGIIPSMDVACSGSAPGGTDAGQTLDLFGTVFSRFQCILELGVVFTTASLTDSTPSSQYVLYLSWHMFRWHENGGHFCMTNGTGVPVCPVDPPSISNCPEYPLLVAILRCLSRFSTVPAMKTYMRHGLRMRPLPSSWVGDYLEGGLQLVTWLNNNAANAVTPANLINHSVWKHVDGAANGIATNDIGIVITSHREANQTFNIYMRSEAYDLSPTAIKVLYKRNNSTGNREEVTRFTDILDYDVTLTYDGSGPAVDLYEVVTL